MIDSQPMLGPILVLVSWTFVMEAWLYACRIPAIFKYKIETPPEITKEELSSKIPRHLQWPADNYNHLMEQPTQFYAVALALNALGANDKMTVSLAWTYVGLRILHSLIQATVNQIPIRLQVFLMSSLTLLGLTGKAAVMLM